ncbi:uncharacterized protein LOC131606577 isoform X2 [Vicia villosa]|uniref:uncharacterized protein LOC131606577 isoform X2 n=1 Tax=Vicia villosa TaxID=3911 RepID=UPI00273C1C32|nr:uncharacterized protein LOC131606577 isoform X2 [Vicia villosa]
MNLQPISVPSITVNELKSVTDSFGTKSFLGEGAYGKVYRAMLKMGRETELCLACGLKWACDDRELASGGNDNQKLGFFQLQNTRTLLVWLDIVNNQKEMEQKY